VRATSIRYLVYSLVLCVALATVVTPIAAQEGEAPSATLSAADIDVEAGEQTQVTATYEFAVDSTGSGDSAMTAISGTIWGFPDHAVGDISATVNGEEVSPDVTSEDRFTTVAVPVEGVSDGDTVEIQLSYTVADPAGALKTPLWVPEFATSGADRVVDVTVALPADTQVQGAAFPRVDTVDGSTLSYELLHVPGFVAVTYGEGASSLFALDVLSSVVGIALILGFLGAWMMYRRNAVRDGGEKSVI
jgi:hypothetical protein